MKRLFEEVKVNAVDIQDGFWSKMQNLMQDTVIPFQEKVLNDEIPDVEKSHAVENFRIAAGLSQGEFYGMVFQDSDVAKWLEGVAYALAIKADPDLEQRADEIIDLIEKAQQPDGYLNTYFTIKEPEHRWQNLHECHELYCAGHMMEAAVAYYEATGKDKLLKVMERMADHIISRFGPGKEPGIPGHEEIEIGLMRLYHATGKEKYLDMAEFFIEERGRNPKYFEEERSKRGWSHWGDNMYTLINPQYSQCHASVYDQKEVVGHSVRAVYLYTAMADLAGTKGNERLYQACKTLWDNMVNRRMYITGGIGSTAEGEAFTTDYDLPNDTIYAETCASIGLVFFAKELLKIKPEGRIADEMERALYNGIISGMQLDGKKFFYVNPLEVNPGLSGEVPGQKHVLPERPGWYRCACCPPNLVRLITSLGKYAWGENEDTIYSHLFIGQTARLDKADISVISRYPWEGEVEYTVSSKTQQPFTVAIRIPAFVKEACITVNGQEIDWRSSLKDGYLYLNRTWGAADKIQLSFAMEVRTYYANEQVRSDAGCVALMRGPLVYCFEGADNGERLQSVRIPRQLNAEVVTAEDGMLGGSKLIKLDGFKQKNTDALYTEKRPEKEPVRLTAIPYYMWGNRGLNQMRVWMLEDGC